MSKISSGSLTVVDVKGGSDGINTATIYLYQRATTAPSKPLTNLTYTFATAKLTGGLGNWTQDIGTLTSSNPIWVIAAVASSNGKTDVIEPTEWSEPIKMAQDGQDGLPGTPGAPGTNGLNQATIFIYKRDDSVEKPNSVTYTFATGSFTVPTGWNTSIPQSNGKPCWVCSAVAIGSDDTAQLSWTNPSVMVEDGSDGVSPVVTSTDNGVQIYDPVNDVTYTITNGADGTSYYTHILYSSKATPTSASDVSTSPTGKDYVGIQTTTSRTAPSWNDSGWQWMKYIGNDGTSVTVSSVKYAKSTTDSQPQDSSFNTTLPTVGEGEWLWTMTTYSDGSKVYTKSKQGKSGTSVTVSKTEYQAGTSATIAPTGEWKTTIPSVAEGQYLWTKTTYSDGNYSYTVAKQGKSGTSITISSTSVKYQVGTSATTAPTGEWKDTVQATTTGQYLWTRTIVTYSDGSDTTSYSVSAHGATGNSISISSIKYAISTTDSQPADSSFGTSIPTVSEGQWLWTMTTYSNGSKMYTKSKQGKSGVSVTSTRELYWLKTNSTNPTQITWNSSTSQPSVTIYSDNKINAWTSVVPAYIANGIYYTCIETTLNNSTKVWSTPVANQGLTDANANAAESLSVSTHANENAQGALSISRATQQHFWFVPENMGSGASLIEAGAYITDTAIDTFKSGKNGGYLLARSDGVELGRGTNKFMTLSATALNFYRPGTNTIDVTLTSKGLVLSKGGIEAGTKNTTNYIYIYSDDDATNHKLTINSHEASDWRIVAGKNFGVDKAGNLYASNANISGTINATHGSIAGDVSIGGNVTIGNSVTIGGKAQSEYLNSNLEIGGRNLLTDTKTWNLHNGNWTISANKYLDFSVISLTWSSGSLDGGVWSNLEGTHGIDIKPDTDYVLSFWAKADANGRKLRHHFYPNLTSTCRSSTGQSSTANDGNVETTLTTEWKRYWVTWHTKDSISGDHHLIVGRAYTTGTFYLAGAKLEKGNKATDWSPAPEDVDAQIDGIQIGGRNKAALSYIWSRTESTYTTNGITFTNLGGGRFSAVGTATNVGDIWWCNASGTSTQLGAGGEYTYTIYLESGTMPANIGLQAAEANSGGTWQRNNRSNGGATTYTFSTNTGNHPYHLGFWAVAANTAINITFRLKFEEGNKSTDWTPAPEDAVDEEQYIYISKASGTTSILGTTTWVTEDENKQNTWSIKRPTYNSSYPVLFVAKQKKNVGGTVTCTTPIKDDTTTIIDGGHITTGTIDTNRLNADTIKSNIVQTTDLSADRIKSGTIDTNRLNADTIKSNIVQTTNLNASKITSGTLDAARIGANSITADKLAIGAVQSGGVNLLLDTGVTRTATISLNSSNYYVYDFYALVRPLPKLFKEGDYVTVSFDWSTNATGGNFRLECGTANPYIWGTVKNASGTRSATSNYIDITSSNMSGHAEITFAITNAVTTAEDALRYFRIRVDGAETASKTITISNAKVERGSSASAWTPAPEDADIEYIIGTQTTITGGWTGTSSKTLYLYNGLRIRYYLPTGPGGNATLNLTNVKGSALGAKSVYRYGTTTLTTQYPTGSIIPLRYNGSAWMVDGATNTDTYDRTRFNNAITANTAITAGRIICGTSTGYKNIGAGVSFDTTCPLLYAENAITANQTSTSNYLTMPSVVATNNGTITSAEAKKVLYLKGTLSGSTFTISASPFMTTEPTTDEGICYIPLGVMYDPTHIYFTSSQDIYAYQNGLFQKVDSVSKYVTQISSEGIWITPPELKPTDTSGTGATGTKIDGDGMDIYQDGTSVAHYGDYARVGKDGEANTTISPNQVTISASDDISALKITPDGNTQTIIKLINIHKTIQYKDSYTQTHPATPSSGTKLIYRVTDKITGKSRTFNITKGTSKAETTVEVSTNFKFKYSATTTKTTITNLGSHKIMLEYISYTYTTTSPLTEVGGVLALGQYPSIGTQDVLNVGNGSSSSTSSSFSVTKTGLVYCRELTIQENDMSINLTTTDGWGIDALSADASNNLILGRGWWLQNTSGYNTYIEGYETNLWGRNKIATNIAITQGSDKRLKKDIKNLEDVKDFVMDLKPVEFKYEFVNDKAKHLGFIAQDVEKSMDAYGLSSDKYGLTTEITGTDNIQYKGLNYTEFIPICIKMIQEQQQEIDALKEALNEVLGN